MVRDRRKPSDTLLTERDERDEIYSCETERLAICCFNTENIWTGDKWVVWYKNVGGGGAEVEKSEIRASDQTTGNFGGK